MDLWRLNIFREVVRQKSFSRAAESIYLSQPTVSSHIKDLEAYYDCRLLDRLEKKVMPTRAGELLYEYAERLLVLEEETRAAMADFKGSIRGRLLIGGSTIPAGYILPPVIAGFVRQYPEVTICLREGDTQAIAKDILSGKLELGVVGAEVSGQNFMADKVMDDEMQVVVAADHRWASLRRIELADLVKEPFIIRERGSGTLMSIEKRLADKHLSSRGLNIVAEMGSTQAVIQGVKNNLGVSILSPVAVAGEVQGGHLKTLAISGLTLSRAFYLIRHRGRTPSPAGRAFVDFMQNHSPSGIF